MGLPSLARPLCAQSPLPMFWHVSLGGPCPGPQALWWTPTVDSFTALYTEHKAGLWDARVAENGAWPGWWGSQWTGRSAHQQPSHTLGSRSRGVRPWVHFTWAGSEGFQILGECPPDSWTWSLRMHGGLTGDGHTFPAGQALPTPLKAGALLSSRLGWVVRLEAGVRCFRGWCLLSRPMYRRQGTRVLSLDDLTLI